MPGSRLSAVAPVTLQLKVLLRPGAIVAGVAVKEAMTGTPAVLTLTATCRDELPAAFVAVKV